MWILWIIFLAGGEAKLNTFPDQQLCQIERDRIGFDMAEAYPYDADFTIECKVAKGNI